MNKSRRSININTEHKNVASNPSRGADNVFLDDQKDLLEVNNTRRQQTTNYEKEFANSLSVNILEDSNINSKKVDHLKITLTALRDEARKLGLRESQVLDLVREAIANDAKGILDSPVLEAESVVVDRRQAQDIVLDEIPHIKMAVEKLMKLKGIVSYQTARGRSALNVIDWLKLNFVATGHLTKRELESIPVWVFRSFDQRLYQALSDVRRNDM